MKRSRFFTVVALPGKLATAGALSLATLVPRCLGAAEHAAWGHWPHWGDQGDGTYRNPVLPADFSDLDCIRVGADY